MGIDAQVEDALRVLIVEDNEDHAALIEQSFEDLEIECSLVFSTSLAACEERMRECVPDVVLLDCFLPDGSGVSWLHDQEIKIERPVIVMTSHGNQVLATEAMQAGAYEYVVKSAESLCDMAHQTQRIHAQWVTEHEQQSLKVELSDRTRDFYTIFDLAPMGMLLVEQGEEESLRIRGVNKALFAISSSADVYLGQLLGRGLCCAKALSSREGCGRFCSGCPLRSVTLGVLKDGKSGSTGEFKMELQGRHGREVHWFEAHATALTATSEGMVLIALHEVTERVEMVARLRRQQGALAFASQQLVTGEERGLEQVVREILEHAAEALDVPRAEVWLDRHAGGGPVKHLVSYDQHGIDVGEVVARLGASDPAYLCLIEKEGVVCVDNVTTDTRVRAFAMEMMARCRAHAYLDCAVIMEGTLSGCVRFMHGRTGRSWQPDEVDFVKKVVSHITQAVLTQAWRDSEEKLHHAMRLKAVGQLAGGVAHDFNNMLGGIVGAADLLSSRLDDAESLQLLNIILEAGQRASELTAKLLAFARKQPVSLERVDVHHVLYDTVSLLRNTVDRRVLIQTDLQAECCVVMGNVSQLQNAFLNLGINAAQAMPEGGQLRVCSRLVDLSEVYCEINPFDLKAGVYLEIEVSDSGIGISREYLERIFEPFFTTKGTGGGNGLGLSAVLGTVQQHGGMIEPYTEEGKGTSFHVLLPLAEQQDEVLTATKQTVRGSGCVLVVDDEPMMRITVEAMLGQLGYDVLLAENGREGVQMFKANHAVIDLVLLDMIMPEMNGRDCFMAMRELDPEVRVLLCSGFAREEELDGLEALGLRGFMMKPFRCSVLSQAVAEALKPTVHGKEGMYS